MRVRLLSEDLVAFRDSQGKLGLLDEYCSHRRASLFFGRNEEGGLRCVYHGWKYDVAGKVLETPAEPSGSQLRFKVHHTAYPCREAAGVIFTYLGPKDRMPPFPSFDWLTVPPDHVTVDKFFIECNYLQALEGDCDNTHAAYLHRGAPVRAAAEEIVRLDTEGNAPLLEVEQTWCGVRSAAIRKVSPDTKRVDVFTFAMPFIGSVPAGRLLSSGLDGFLAVYQAPADDWHTSRYNIRFKKSGPMSREEREFDKYQVGPNYRFIANKGNGYLLDRVKQKAGSYTGLGVEGLATQDACITESMGPIVDRTGEHLGGGDVYLIAVRRFLLKAVRDFQKGIEPPGLVRDPAKNDFSAANCTSAHVRLEASWKLTDADGSTA